MNSSDALRVSTSPHRRSPLPPYRSVPRVASTLARCRASPKFAGRERCLDVPPLRDPSFRHEGSRIGLRSPRGSPGKLIQGASRGRQRRAFASAMFAVIAACRFFAARCPRYMPPRARVDPQSITGFIAYHDRPSVCHARARALDVSNSVNWHGGL